MQTRLMIFSITAIFCATANAQMAPSVRTEAKPDQGAARVDVSNYSDDFRG
jgi:hypothetical protein